MAGSVDEDAAETWGTWENLLLASAVRRHGVHRWDSVAMELRARTRAPDAVTAEQCEERFRRQQRRFLGSDGGESGGMEEKAYQVPWFEELRRLRVAELRREVERCDVSIMSLELKLKRLKDEYERTERAGGGGAPDLKTEEKGTATETAGVGTENRDSGWNSGRSWSESNSTDPKEATVENKGAESVAKTSDPAAAAADEKSCNASSQAGLSRAAADSKGGRESSDVQSSASLPRRRRARLNKAAPGGDNEVRAMKKRAEVKSGPLFAILEMIRASKHGSVFERRRERQESVRYRRLIRRHVDLEMVRSKLEAGASYSAVEFFRDLLLLCANAAVFYPDRSPESLASVHLRRLIAKEMANAFPYPSQPSAKQATQLPPPVVTDEKPSVERTRITPLPLLVACRKRTSRKAGRVVKEEEKNEEEMPKARVKSRVRSSSTGKAEKPDDGAKGQSAEPEESIVRKKARERMPAVTVSKGLRRNKNSRGGGGAVAKSSVSVAESKALEEKSSGRRGSAADMLSRMKKEQSVRLKVKEGAAEGKNEQAVRQRSGGGVTTRLAGAKGGAPLKRGVGRPSKKEAVVLAKRGKAEAEEEEEAAPPPPSKRGRRRR